MAHSRRDFLLLRPGRQARVLDLPCRRLYMRYVEARTAAGREFADAGPEGPAYVPDASVQDAGGEPPSDIAPRTVEDLFAALDRELRDADAVRLVDVEWLADPDLRRELDRVLNAFRARGGDVQ